MPDPQRARSFWSELKRRHVYRVAAVYCAVAFVVWQVADILVPALRLPDWIMKVVVIGPILTFPLAMVIAWAYDLTPHGIRAADTADAPAAGTDSVAASPGGRTSDRSKRRVVGAVAGAVLFIVAGAWWTTARLVARSPDFNAVSLAVFPFTVRGNDGPAYLREGLVDLLSRNLAGATELQPLDPSLMLKVTGGTEPEDVPAAGNIARSVGAGRFLIGFVNGTAGQVRIDATLYAMRDSVRQVATKTVQGDTTQIFALIDELTAGLLGELAQGAASERLVRTAAVTTQSLPALKGYLEGEQGYRKGNHEDAADAFQRALAADSGFALARYRLAMTYHMRGEHDAAYREIAGALHQTDRLSARERRVLEAFHAFHAGEITDAERRLREIVASSPVIWKPVSSSPSC